MTVIHFMVHLKVGNFKLCNFCHNETKSKTKQKQKLQLETGVSISVFIREDVADEAGQMDYISVAKRKSGDGVIERKSGSALSIWD